MKHLYCLIFFLLIQQFSQAQDIYAYYDKAWKKTDKEHAAYYRTIEKLPGKKYKTIDHYLSGAPQMELYSDVFPKEDTSASSEITDGYYIYFDSTGNKKSEGISKKDKRIGVWKYYWKGEGGISCIEEQKTLNDSEKYCFGYYSLTKKKIMEGKTINDKKNGIWKQYGYQYSGYNEYEAIKKAGERYRTLKLTQNSQPSIDLDRERVFDSIKYATIKEHENDKILREILYKYDVLLNFKITSYYNSTLVSCILKYDAIKEREEIIEYYKNGKIKMNFIRDPYKIIKSRCYDANGTVYKCPDYDYGRVKREL